MKLMVYVTGELETTRDEGSTETVRELIVSISGVNPEIVP